MAPTDEGRHGGRGCYQGCGPRPEGVEKEDKADPYEIGKKAIKVSIKQSGGHMYVSDQLSGCKMARPWAPITVYFSFACRPSLFCGNTVYGIQFSCCLVKRQTTLFALWLPLPSTKTTSSIKRLFSELPTLSQYNTLTLYDGSNICKSVQSQ